MLKINSFKKALKIFETEISNKYLSHEKTFDLESFHGRFHILRCLFLAKSMIKYYENNGTKVDTTQVYFSIMFHDIARENNGIDLWEKESALACFNYLLKNNYDIHYAEKCSRLILKQEIINVEGQILYDVDVLDYHRFFILDDEQGYFESERLIFLYNNDITNIVDFKSREKVIQLSKDLVHFSAEILIETPTSNLIQLLNDRYQEVKP